MYQAIQNQLEGTFLTSANGMQINDFKLEVKIWKLHLLEKLSQEPIKENQNFFVRISSYDRLH